jgi:uncharacterized protein with FMN-binding domain
LGLSPEDLGAARRVLKGLIANLTGMENDKRNKRDEKKLLIACLGDSAGRRGVFGFGFFMTRGLEQLQNEPVSTREPRPCGGRTYDGRYTQGRFSNEVRVTVKYARITNIELLEACCLSARDRQRVVRAYYRKQRHAVDAVTGATVTSKAYQKAIENALSN